MIVTNAKVTVLAAALASVGALANTAEAPVSVPILWTVAMLSISFFATLRILRQRKIRARLSDASRSREKCIATLMLLSLIAVVTYESAANRTRPPEADLTKYSGRDVVFTGTVDSQNLVNNTHFADIDCTAMLFPQAGHLCGKTRILFSKLPSKFKQSIDLSENNVSRMLEIKVYAHVLNSPKNPPPWEYNNTKKLAAFGIHSVCRLERETKTFDPLVLTGETEAANNAPVQRFERFFAQARGTLVDTHRRHLPLKLADLFSSIVLGNRAVILPAETTEKFREVGLSHILAASGFNLTIVTVMTFFICRALSIPALAANLFCLVSMLGFVSLAGPSPSVLRAALMCAIVLIAKSRMRRALVLSALAFSFLLTVLFDPLCTNDLGLQLSYAATVGIVLGCRPFSNLLYQGKNKWRRGFAEAISVVLIAQFSVMPIQLFFFWKAGWLFIPANLVITPLVTPVTMIGFTSSVLALIASAVPAIASALEYVIAFADALAFIPLACIYLAVEALCSTNITSFCLGPPTPLGVMFYYTSFCAFFAAMRVHRFVAQSLFLFSLAMILLLFRAAPPLLEVAAVQRHMILINARHEALDLDADDKKLCKVVERFCTYSGAQIKPEEFQTGRLKSGISFARSQDWLLISIPDRYITLRDFQLAEVLLTARKYICKHIIVLKGRSTADLQDLLKSEYKLNPDKQLIKLTGLPFTSVTVYSKN